MNLCEDDQLTQFGAQLSYFGFHTAQFNEHFLDLVKKTFRWLLNELEEHLIKKLFKDPSNELTLKIKQQINNLYELYMEKAAESLAAIKSKIEEIFNVPIHNNETNQLEEIATLGEERRNLEKQLFIASWYNKILQGKIAEFERFIPLYKQVEENMEIWGQLSLLNRQTLELKAAQHKLFDDMPPDKLLKAFAINFQRKFNEQL